MTDEKEHLAAGSGQGAHHTEDDVNIYSHPEVKNLIADQTAQLLIDDLAIDRDRVEQIFSVFLDAAINHGWSDRDVWAHILDNANGDLRGLEPDRIDRALELLKKAQKELGFIYKRRGWKAHRGPFTKQERLDELLELTFGLTAGQREGFYAVFHDLYARGKLRGSPLWSKLLRLYPSGGGLTVADRQTLETLFTIREEWVRL